MQVILSFLAGIILFHAFHYFPHLTVFSGILGAALLFSRRKPVLVLTLIVGVAYAFLRSCPAYENSFPDQTATFRCRFETYPAKTEKGFFSQQAVILSEIGRTASHGGGLLSGREVVIVSEREFSVGREYALAVKFLRSNRRMNPGSWTGDMPYARLSTVLEEGAAHPSIQAKLQHWRHSIYSYIAENFQKDTGALVASITIGHRAEVSHRMRDAFNTTGLAHILSISGTHFGLFSVFLFGFFRLVVRALPYPLLQRATLYMTPAQAAALLSLPFMIAYLGISGGTIPAIRSFIMIGLFLCGLLISRKGFWLNSLLFAAMVITLWQPNSLFSLSFQLSFLAVLFIGFAIGRADPAGEGSTVKKYVKNSVLLTLSASLGTAPLVAYYFNYISLISPVSNLVVAPLIGFVIIPLSVISAFVFLITGYYPFTSVISSVADITMAGILKLSEVPFADVRVSSFPPIIVILFYVGALLIFLLRKRRCLALVVFIPICAFIFTSILDEDNLTVTFLDVGQGDAAVVELPDGKTLVVDTGMTGREVASFLRYRGKSTIEALLLSHPHPDHSGGLEFIAERFRIGQVWHSSKMLMAESSAHAEPRALERGDVIEGKGYIISVLHPYPEFYTLRGNTHVEENNDSLVLRISGRNGSFLFAGDVEYEAEDDMLHLGKWLESDVLKFPHHGGRTSAHEPFLRLVDPDIVVISVEKNNRFGHPHQETLDMLSGRKVLRTDTDGAIRIMERASGYDIRTYADFQLERAGSINGEWRNIKRLFQEW